MSKILLALADESLENYFMKMLPDYEFTSKQGLNRGMVINIMQQENIDILVIREKLPTSKDANGNDIKFDTLMATIRKRYPHCRIVIVAGPHTEGDEFLKRMVSRSIYDIVYGSQIDLEDVIALIRNGNTYADAQRLQGFDDVVEDASPAIKDARHFVNNVSETDSKISEKRENITNVIKNSAKNNMDIRMQRQPVQISYSEQEIQYTSAVQQYQNQYEVQKMICTGIIFNPARPEDYYSFGDNTGILVGSSLMGGIDGPQRNNTWSVKGQTRIISFVSSREGVGCTSQAINTAVCLASMGKNVLLFDAHYGHSCIYEKLGLPHSEGTDFIQLINNYKAGAGLNGMCLSRKSLSDSMSRYNCIPDTLSFLRFPDTEVMIEADASYVMEVLKDVGREFDYIITDVSLKNNDGFTKNLLTVSSKVCVVITQDVYEINNTDLALSNFVDFVPNEKILLIINHYIKSVMPDKKACCKQFRTHSAYLFPTDTKGYIKATANGLSYFSLCKKCRDGYRNLCENI